MPVLVAVCAKCADIKYRSNRDILAGEKLKAEWFEPVGTQNTPAVDSQPMTCDDCGGGLKIAPDMVKASPSAPIDRATLREQMAKRTGIPGPPTQEVVSTLGYIPPTQSAAAITLFEVGKDEVIKDMKYVGETGIVIITDKRIVSVDLAGGL
jgi:hypothetical protein